MKKSRTKIADNLFRIDYADGRSYFVVRVCISGKQKEKSLGSAKTLTARQAKLMALQAITDLRLSAPASGEIEMTFSDIYEKAIDDIGTLKQWRNPKSRSQWRNTIHTYAVPVIGSMPMQEITRDHIVKVLEPIWQEKPETARKLQQRLDAVFQWADVHGFYHGQNPASWRGNLALCLPQISKVRLVKHHEAPTVPELRRVVKDCLRGGSNCAAALLFVIATVSRISEVRQATVEQIKNGAWIVPQDAQKCARDDRRVPLSALAWRAIEQAGSPKEGPLFPSTGGRLIAVDSMRMRMCRCLHRSVTAHGIRSTFRDWCARKGIRDDVAEKCLSHVWGNEVTRAYYRDDLFEERSKVLERWAKEMMKP